MRKIKSSIAMLVMMAGTAFSVPTLASSAAECVPQDAYTETVVVTPAVAEVPEVPAIPAVTQTIPATPDLWWNWSPNKNQGPFEGPPAFPVDSRGTWQGPHESGGPSQDTYGTFQQGNGNGSWFHREKGSEEQVIVISPEVPAVPGTPAVPEVTETIDHPAVVCGAPVQTPTPEVAVPAEEEDPVVSTHTQSSPHKTVKTHTHESGRVTEEVTNYPTDAEEEGL